MIFEKGSTSILLSFAQYAMQKEVKIIWYEGVG